MWSCYSIGYGAGNSNQAPLFWSVISPHPFFTHVVAGPPRGTCLFALRTAWKRKPFLFFFLPCPGSGRGVRLTCNLRLPGCCLSVCLSLAISKFRRTKLRPLSMFPRSSKPQQLVTYAVPYSSQVQQHNTTQHVSRPGGDWLPRLCTGAVAVAVRSARARARGCVLLQHAMQVRVQCSAMRCSEVPRISDRIFFLWE